MLHTIAYPPAEPGATALPILPFSFGADAFDAGHPITANWYPAGTVEHDRFAAGWHAAQSVREGEAADVAAEIAADAALGLSGAACA